MIQGKFSRDSYVDIPLGPGSVLSKCAGQDITRRGAKIKGSRVMIVLPSQLTFRPESEVTLGLIDKANTENPELVINTVEGELRYKGRFVQTSTLFFTLNLQPRKLNSVCEDVFDKVLIFEEPCQKTDENSAISSKIGDIDESGWIKSFGCSEYSDPIETEDTSKSLKNRLTQGLHGNPDSDDEIVLDTEDSSAEESEPDHTNFRPKSAFKLKDKTPKKSELQIKGTSVVKTAKVKTTTKKKRKNDAENDDDFQLQTEGKLTSSSIMEKSSSTRRCRNSKVSYVEVDEDDEVDTDEFEDEGSEEEYKHSPPKKRKK